MKKLYYLILLSFVAFAGCKKTEFDDEIKGEALGAFQVTAPADNAIVVLNAALPSDKIVISWTAATPGVSLAPTYTFQAFPKTGASEAPLLEFIADNSGKDPKLTLTQKQLDDALKAKGIAEGVKTDLTWKVIADNGSVKVSTDPKTISITRMGDGVSNFVLYGPLSSSASMEINPGSTTDFINFKWQAAVPGKAANPVTYKIKFVAQGGSFSTPLFEVTSDNSGADAAAKISYQKMDQLLTAAGFTDQSAPANLQWTVEATSGNFKKTADYVNDLSIVREVKLFIVGGATPIGWNPDKAIQMTPDTRNPGSFFIYVNLTADGFKFLSENTAWDSATQKIYGKGASDGILFQDGGSGNIDVTTAGVYRVTADLKNNRYYVQRPNPGAVGLVGAFQGWDPSTAVKLNYFGVNKFIGLVNMTMNDEFKMHDGAEWDNSAPNKSRFYGTGATAGKLYDDGGSQNLKNSIGTGLIRVIFDGSDIKNTRYSLTQGKMYLIGAATAGGWDNAASNNLLPEMSYAGNGRWTVTTNLVAGEFKFIVQKGSWDFNYGKDGTNGIKEGGDNLSVAADGNYTITINEYTRSFTVVKN